MTHFIFFLLYLQHGESTRLPQRSSSCVPNLNAVFQNVVCSDFSFKSFTFSLADLSYFPDLFLQMDNLSSGHTC